MAPLPRFSLFACVLLLAACAAQAPTPQPVVVRFEHPIAPGAANDVLFRALGLVGTPYRYGGNTPQGGFDCSGLIGYVYRDAAGIQLPRSTREMISLRAPVVGREALQSGDLLFFSTGGARQVNHAGIYVGEGRFVHAPSTGGTVRLDNLSAAYWQKSYLEAKRVLQAPQWAGTP